MITVLVIVLLFNAVVIAALVWHTIADGFEDAESLDRHVSARAALRKVVESDP